MRTASVLLAPFLLASCFNTISVGPVTVPMENTTAPAATTTFFDLRATDIHGNETAMAQWKGRKVLVVNTASECGYTPQYAQLQEIWEAHREKGLVIIGFPCDQFGGQEPGTEAEIGAFCQKNYGVTFPMMAKVAVKGADKHPVYAWLTEKRLNGRMDVEVTWNFQKFLINEDGTLATTVAPATEPSDDAIMNWIEGRR